MLSKSIRLKKEDFSLVMSDGTPFYITFFVIKMIKTSKNNRFAVSVPKKVSKLAVTRNKIRRRVYEVIDTLEERLVGGYDMVFIAKKGIQNLNIEKLQNELETFFVKNKLLK